MGHPGLRLFAAIYPPPEVVAALGAPLAGLDLPPHRVVPLPQVHLTVHFIGDTPARRLDATIETLRRAAAGLAGFDLAPQRLITLPRRGRARLVAAETDRPPALLELQRRLAARLTRAARRQPGDHFRPHLTLCRFRTPAPMKALDRPVAAPPFAVRGVALVRSTLNPGGAQHDVVMTAELVSQ